MEKKAEVDIIKQLKATNKLLILLVKSQVYLMFDRGFRADGAEILEKVTKIERGLK